MKEERKMKEEKARVEMSEGSGQMSQMPLKPSMQEMPAAQEVPGPAMQPLQQMPSMHQMPPMQQMPSMYQMPPMMQAPMAQQMPYAMGQMPMLCCPLLINAQCPMLYGQMGAGAFPAMYGQGMTGQYAAAPYPTGQYAAGPYTMNPYMCGTTMGMQQY